MTDLPTTAAKVRTLQIQMTQAQMHAARASEQTAIDSRQLVDTTRLLADPSVRSSTTGEALTPHGANLLSIPRELRDEVFSYILVQERSISLYYDHDFEYDSVKQPYLALSSTNRQLREEVGSMFFAKNRFMWSITYPLGSIPGTHLRRMPQIDFHSSRNRCCMRIYLREAELEIYWYGQKWTIPASGGRISSSESSSWVGQRPYRVLLEFQSLIVQGMGMNMEAMQFIGRESRGLGLTR